MSSNSLPSQLLSDKSSSYVDDEIDLRELFTVLLLAKWKIFIITAVFALLGVVYSLSVAPVYQIQAQLYIDNTDQPLTKVVSTNSTQVINVPSLSLGKEMEILNLPQMRAMLIDKLKLVAFFEQQKVEMSADDVTLWLKKELNIKTEKGRDGVVIISMQSEYVEMASRIINTLIDSYLQEQVVRSVANMQSTLDILDQKDAFSQQALKDMAREQVKVLTHAKVSQYPVKPKKTLIVVLATLLGGMLSAFIVFFMEMFKTGIKKEQELENLGLTVLASLNDDSLEALRFLRTSMQYQLQSKDKRIAMLSSVSEDVGKRFVVENLAILEVKTGKKVLLIDADMRMNSLNELFTTDENAVSLASLLKEDAFNAESISLGKTDIEQLSFIAAGESSENPAELLTKASFTQLLEWANKTFDVVIINTPCVLEYADACIIGEHIGVNVMVVRANQTTLDEMKDAVKQFNQSGVLVDGVVFNRIA